MKNKLMRYIPREYKPHVVNIYQAGREWNPVTRRYNTLITVEWDDETENTYQNASHMNATLKYFGR